MTPFASSFINGLTGASRDSYRTQPPGFDAMDFAKHPESYFNQRADAILASYLNRTPPPEPRWHNEVFDAGDVAELGPKEFFDRRYRRLIGKYVGRLVDEHTFARALERGRAMYEGRW